MKKTNVKIRITVVFALVTILFLTSILSVPKAKASTNTKVDDAWYSVISDYNGTVQYEKSAKNYTVENVPNTVKIGNKLYKVTSIADGAFKNRTKLLKIYIGENVEKIGKNAFCGCKYLVSINIRSDKLSKSSVGSSAFAKISPQAMAVVPRSKLSSYKDILKKRGMNKKKQKVKTEKVITFGPDKPLPKPDASFFTIGDYSIQGAPYAENHECRDSNNFTKDEVIHFTSGILLHHDIYGAWNTQKTAGCYYLCRVCKRQYNSKTMFALHITMTSCGCFSFFVGDVGEAVFTADYFVPDPAPCKVVYHFTLPHGLSYKEGSLKVYNTVAEKEIGKDKYHTEVSGPEITVTIDDIKSMPFHCPFNEQEYFKYNLIYDRYIQEDEGFRNGFNVLFGVIMNENIASENIVTSSVTYSYKGAEKTVDLGSASIHVTSLKIKNTDENGNSLNGASFTLYQKRGEYKESSAVGVLKWTKIAEGLKADEIITGIGSGKKDGENSYRIVQDVFPEGYEETEEMKFKDLDFTVKITDGGTTVTAKDSGGRKLPVEDGVINITVVNKAK